MKQLVLSIGLATAILALTMPMLVHAAPMIEISTYKKQIGASDSIMIIGNVDGITPFKPVTLTVTDPSGNVIYAPTILADGDGKFKWTFHPTLPKFAAGTYTVEASHEDLESIASLEFTVIGMPGSEDPEVIPEFGPIAVLIMVIAIAGTIAFSAKFTRFNIKP